MSVLGGAGGRVLLETFVAALLTALATGLGAVPFLAGRPISKRWIAWAWAFAGGLMVTVSVLDLLIPALTAGPLWSVSTGTVLGVVPFWFASRWIHQRNAGIAGWPSLGTARIVIVLTVLTVHSFPEGVAVGVAYGSGEIALGLTVALAIAIHNIPEGIAVSIPLYAAGTRGWRLPGWSIFSSLPQPLMAVPAALAVTMFERLLPAAFALAAGAMLFLVVTEMLPASREEGASRSEAAIALLVGGAVMIVLRELI